VGVGGVGVEVGGWREEIEEEFLSPARGHLNLGGVEIGHVDQCIILTLESTISRL
jgi:hypothetical protein